MSKQICPNELCDNCNEKVGCLKGYGTERYPLLKCVCYLKYKELERYINESREGMLKALRELALVPDESQTEPDESVEPPKWDYEDDV